MKKVKKIIRVKRTVYLDSQAKWETLGNIAYKNGLTLQEFIRDLFNRAIAGEV